MKIVILGGSGMLGHKLYQTLSEDFETYVTIRQGSDIWEQMGIFPKKSVLDNIDAFRFREIKELFVRLEPNVVINAIGIIKQLDEAKNKRMSIYVNSLFPHLLADLCSKIGAKLIQVSTDCVFSGKKGAYIESDEMDANDLYGRSKILGEVTEYPHLTIRTSIIGHELTSSHSLVEWFLSKNHGNVKGYVNATYTGLTTIELSRQIKRIITQYPELYGCYHISSNRISKFELLGLIKKTYNLDINIEAFMDFVCDRSLDSTKYRQLCEYSPPPWQQMIEEMHGDPTTYKWKKNL